MTPRQAADLSGVRAVRVADVFKAGKLAAKLRRSPEGVEFAYTPDYLDAGGPAVATTLPLTERSLIAPAGAVPAFFAGLLPEGRRLSSLRRAVKTSADDDLSLLLAVGRNPVGDVQVVPEAQEPRPAETLVSVTTSFEEVTFAQILKAGIVNPVALAGVQDKASARMLSVPVGQAHRRFILKVDPPEFPHVVENEAYFIKRAARFGFPVVNGEIVHDSTGRPGLLVTRFNRVIGPAGSPLALAVEDGTQVMNLYPADKYAVSSEDLTTLAEVCPARAVATRAVFRQVCYAWLTGDGDVHAKNISLVATLEGEWRVAPMYDLPSTLPYRDHTLALSVGGKWDGLSGRQLLMFAERVGLAARAAIKILDEVLAATEDLPEEPRVRRVAVLPAGGSDDGAVATQPAQVRQAAQLTLTGRTSQPPRRETQRPLAPASVPRGNRRSPSRQDRRCGCWSSCCIDATPGRRPPGADGPAACRQTCRAH